MTIESESPEREPWKQLRELLPAGQPGEIEAFLDGLAPGETARAISRLEEQEHRLLLELLGASEAADLVDELPDAQALELIEELPAEQAAAILDEMPSDSQADILGDLPVSEADEILEAMEPREASTARALLEYPDDTAGGLMVAEYLAFPETHLVSDVLDDLRLNRELYSDFDIQYTYVVDEDGQLVGVLPIRDLVLAAPDQAIRDLMVANPLSVPARQSLEELKRFLGEHAFLGVPVVDAEQRLVGVVLRSAVEEAFAEEANSRFLKVSGHVEEELRSMPVRRRASRRLSWLSVNVVLNVVAASVIAFYQDTLEAVIALAVFLPIISDMSGCSGNQAVAVSIRELSLGLVKPYEMMRTLGKELSVGLINGLALGGLLALVAGIWKANPYLGLVVGGAMFLNTLVAVSLGGLVPLALKRLGVDPAVASGPILTTVTDMCGFLLVLSMATALLTRLT